MPKTQIDVLRKIETKAEHEKAYGQLLKAEFKRLALTINISPDSLKPAVDELLSKEGSTDDAVLKAVYDAVLYKTYERSGNELDGADTLAAKYRRLAMAEPRKLAAASASDFDPFVVKGYNASVFGGDMLSVVGYEVGDFETLWRYYREAGMRPAACITGLELLKQHRPSGSRGLKKSEYLRSIDSITHAYADLDIACEAAIERYEYMSGCHDVKAEDQINYINHALGKWGGWQRANLLRNAQRQLTCPQFRVETNSRVARPGESRVLKLSELRNITSLTMNVYRVRMDGDTDLGRLGTADYKNLKPLLTELPDKRQVRGYMGHPAYQLFDDSLTIDGLPVGVYMIEFQTSPATETVRELYFVSDVFCMSQAMPDNAIRYVVVSATTGQPLPGAKIRLGTGRQGKDADTRTLTCNELGEAVYMDKDAPIYIYAYTDDDKAAPRFYSYNHFGYYRNDRDADHMKVFTDRGIYRPGQTVHVAVLAYNGNHNREYNTVERAPITLTLRDANYKVVAEKALTTDKYGACSADFALPVGLLNGRFTVVASYASKTSSATIRVEEYKRPTFLVEFPKINEKYQNGDTIMVRAKATTYAGTPVQGAKVSYNITRRPALWWRGFIPGKGMATQMLGSDETITGDDGSFVVSVPMVLPDDDGQMPMFYNFEVEASVTDVAGETRHGSMSIPLGNRATAFSCDLPGLALADSLKTITFSLRNAAGMEIGAEVELAIDGTTIAAKAHTGQPFELPMRLNPGRHSIFAVCESDTLKQEFIVFGIDDVKPCVDIHDWFYVSSGSFPADGGPVTVQVGASDNDVHIVYSIISGDKLIESGVADKSNELINRKFTYSEDYGDGLLLNYAWVKNGRCYTHNVTISRPVPDKRLKLKWTTFRDHLTPGQTEEWSLAIERPDGTPADARLMATLYDKSLDQIVKHNWRLEPSQLLTQPYTMWRFSEWSGLWVSGSQQWRMLSYKDFAPSRMDQLVFPVGLRYDFYLSRMEAPGKVHDTGMVRAMAAKAEAKQVAMADVANGSREMVFDTVESDDMADEVITVGYSKKSDRTSGGEVQMRENLNETAFFYPEAHTDSTGNVTLKFTLPESLTTWRFMGLAHTVDMCVGSLEGEAVAKKDVMIQPNMPRFVRVGDHAQISARIFNTGTADASGTARLEMIDPETDKRVFVREHSFKVASDKTGVVTFDYTPDGTHALLICRITALGRSFSDGEQHYLPILPDRERVTITVPFTQNGPGTETVEISKLFPKKDKTNKLTIEYTNNPAWIIVQSLPAVSMSCADNAIDQATSLYVNALASNLVKQNPGMKTVFEQWMREPAGDGSSLTSSLSKNSELKDLVLAETPWVADADREEEQKRQLSVFYDESTMQSRISSSVDKLKKLQKADGSWSWWPGMDGSLYMTVEVAQMLVRLNVMTGPQESTAQMLDRAFGYIGKEIVKDVNKMKADEKKGVKPEFPGTKALRFLYISALDGRKLPAEVQSASDYLIALLKKDIRKQDIYDKALTAIVLAGHGEMAKSREYVKSLKEYSVYTDEAGRYYDTRRASYSWYDYRIPTEVAAIEAIAKVTSEDTLTIEEMRRWLLHEKRAQAWDTPINSVNATYSFLAGNKTVTASRPQTVIAIDGKPLDMPKATAGLGYVKTAVDAPTGKTLTAVKTSNDTSWGAVYAQYMQKTSEVETSESGISVNREIVLKKKAGEGAETSGADGDAVDAHHALSVGDRIVVRITVEARRDLDFVQIVDRRAACMEPVGQLSGYRGGAYCSPKDNATNYYFDRMAKGKHVIETEYYIDRAGIYETGTCAVSCAYAPEYRATVKSQTLKVK